MCVCKMKLETIALSDICVSQLNVRKTVDSENEEEGLGDPGF